MEEDTAKEEVTTTMMNLERNKNPKFDKDNTGEEPRSQSKNIVPPGRISTTSHVEAPKMQRTEEKPTTKDEETTAAISVPQDEVKNKSTTISSSRTKEDEDPETSYAAGASNDTTSSHNNNNKDDDICENGDDVVNQESSQNCMTTTALPPREENWMMSIGVPTTSTFEEVIKRARSLVQGLLEEFPDTLTIIDGGKNRKFFQYPRVLMVLMLK